MPQSLNPLKIPKLPFIAGYVLLFALGCCLAVFSDWPPSLGVITAAILAGFFGVVALTIPWLIEWFSQNTVERHQSAQADQTFHFVVGRLEQALDRLKTAEDEASKAILIARQIPDRIAEQQTALLDAMATRESDELSNLRTEAQSLREEVTALRQFDPESLERMAADCQAAAVLHEPLSAALEQITSLREAVTKGATSEGTHRSLLGGMNTHLMEIERKLTELPDKFPQPAPLPEGAEESEIEDVGGVMVTALESALAPIVSRLEQKLEELTHKLESVEKRLDTTMNEKFAALEATPTKVLEHDVIVTPPATGAKIVAAAVAPSIEKLAADEIASSSVERESTPIVKQSDAPLNETKSEREPTKPRKGPGDNRQPTLFSDESHPTRVTVEAECMIGITNKLYLRGEGPWLSWEKGVPLEVVGIGRWRWTCDGVKKPIVCKIYRNDTDPADGDTFTLEPGKPIKVQPRFSRSTHS